MKNNKGFTLIEIIAVIVLIAVISLIAFLSVTTVIKNNKIKQLKVFSDNLTNAAEVYITAKKDEFPNFNKAGDITVISSAEMVQAGYLDKNMDNPTGKELTDFYIKATIKEDKSVSYEVIG